MRVLLCVPLLALAVAAGCGGGERVSLRGAVGEAASSTLDASSFRQSVDVALTAAGESATMTGEGVFDADAAKGRMTLDLSNLPGLAGGEGEGLGEVEMVVDGNVLYMRMPFLQAASPKPKPWLKVDLQALARQQGVDLGQLQQLGSQSDPRQALSYLRAASDDVEEVGREEVRGVETTRYRMTVDLARVADAAPAEERPALEASLRALRENTGVEEVPTEVWIDEDGLVRRQRFVYRDMRLAPGQTGDMTTTVELYDFGVSVDVQPPPRDQVMDIRALLGQGS